MLNSALTDVANTEVVEVTSDEMGNMLLDITLVGDDSDVGVCSLLDRLPTGTTVDVDATTMAVVNATLLVVTAAIEAPSKLCKSDTELIDMLVDISDVVIVCKSKVDVVNTGITEVGISSVAELTDMHAEDLIEQSVRVISVKDDMVLLVTSEVSNGSVVFDGVMLVSIADVPVEKIPDAITMHGTNI